MRAAVQGGVRSSRHQGDSHVRFTFCVDARHCIDAAGRRAGTRGDRQRYALAGFQKTEEVSPGRRGLGLGESELNLFANVDDKFAGNLTVSLTPENTVSVEEAYGYMPSLANGIV